MHTCKLSQAKTTKGHALIPTHPFPKVELCITVKCKNILIQWELQIMITGRKKKNHTHTHTHTHKLWQHQLHLTHTPAPAHVHNRLNYHPWVKKWVFSEGLKDWMESFSLTLSGRTYLKARWPYRFVLESLGPGTSRRDLDADLRRREGLCFWRRSELNSNQRTDVSH